MWMMWTLCRVLVLLSVLSLQSLDEWIFHNFVQELLVFLVPDGNTLVRVLDERIIRLAHKLWCGRCRVVWLYVQKLVLVQSVGRTLALPLVSLQNWVWCDLEVN